MSKLEEKFDQLKNNLRPLSPAISQPPVDRRIKLPIPRAKTEEKPADSTISLNKQTNLNFMVSKFKQQISNMVQKSTLTPEQQCKVEKILISNRALFSLEGDPPTITYLVQHHIDAGDARPVAKHYYRGTIQQRHIV
uniref:Uncharacterized protein n=1 Tax=Romanomermis culicivorax TaxID=13658 RepID=A0A915J1M0_ROMCU